MHTHTQWVSWLERRTEKKKRQLTTERQLHTANGLCRHRGNITKNQNLHFITKHTELHFQCMCDFVWLRPGHIPWKFDFTTYISVCDCVCVCVPFAQPNCNLLAEYLVCMWLSHLGRTQRIHNIDKVKVHSTRHHVQPHSYGTQTDRVKETES